MSEMNEEEIRRLVHEVLISEFQINENAWKQHRKNNGSVATFAYNVHAPLELELDQSMDGKVISFILSLPNDPGGLTVSYSPQYFLVDYVKTAQKEHGNGYDVDFQEKIRKDIGGLIRLFLFSFPFEMAETANLQMLLSLKIRDFLTAEDFLQRKGSDEQAEIDEIIKFANKERVNRISSFKKQQIASLTAPKYLFSIVYEKRIKIWRIAKKFYTSNKKYKTWKKMFEVEFENEFADFGFPDDLIEKLSLQGESAPRSLALEETSQILEIPTKKVETERLGDFLKQSQDEAKLVSSVKAAADLKEFLDYKKKRDAYKREEKL